MNDVYYFISPSNNNDSCVYMTTDNHQDFTTLPPEPGKTIIYFTSKKLAEKYIKNIIKIVYRILQRTGKRKAAFAA